MTNNPLIILAIDGGGIRGIIPAYILNQIEQTVGMPCYKMFDIIGGTSTGGILSAGLTTPNPNSNTGTMPFTAAELLNIYETRGASIFVAQNCEVDYCATYVADDGKGKGVEPFLQEIAGKRTTLSYAQKTVTALAGARIKQMFTTGYIVNSTGNTVQDPVQGKDFGPYLFNWADAAVNPNDDYYVWEAARATSAAPVYFPIANVGGGAGNRSPALSKWVLDGGTMSNNPAVWGFSEAFRLGLASSINNIVIISLGTGVYPGENGIGIHTNYGHLTPDNGNWSETPWMLEKMYDLEGYETDATLLNIILSAVPLVADCQLNALIKAGLQYYRLEPFITQSLGAMDDVSPSNIRALQTAADKYISDGGAGNQMFNDIIKLLKAQV